MDSLKLLIVFLCAGLAFSEPECRPIEASDLGNTDSLSQDGLIADSYVSGGDSSDAVSVRLFDFSVVCLSAGPTRGMYRHVSLVAEYACSGASCESTTENITAQFDFGCVMSGTSGTEWNDLVVSVADDDIRTQPADAGFSTALRRDCFLCLNENGATALGLTTDAESHCVGKWMPDYLCVT